MLSRFQLNLLPTLNLTAEADLPTLLLKAYNVKRSFLNRQKLANLWKMSTESMSWITYSQKTFFMPVVCLRIGHSLKNVHQHSHFRPLGWWGRGARGKGVAGWKAAVAKKQSKNPVAAETQPFICRLSVQQTPEDFLP